MKKKRRWTGGTIMILSLIFFYLPIAFMVVFSFNSSKSLTSFTGFSTRWYEQMFASHDMMSSLYVTIVIALLATVISTLVGTLTSIGMVYSKKLVRQYITQVNDLPMMNPEIVTAIGLMLLFITFKIERGFWTLLLAHVAFCIPYVILSVSPKLRTLDPNLADAAMDLGASPFTTLTKVIIPEIMPGIVSGAMIAFTMSFDDFIISYFSTGKGVKNLSIMVYTMSKRVNPSINAISSLVVLFITIGLILVNVLPPIIKKHQDKKVEEQGEQPAGRNKGPRNIMIGLVALAVLCSGLFFARNSLGGSQEFAGQELHLYLPGEYLSDEMVANFEAQTGAKVIVENFDSNEQAYIKLANGESYDVVIPSDYMIQRLIDEGYLQKLDQSKIQDSLLLMDEEVLGRPFDPENEYSVPYFWGTVGIIYDKEKVSEEDLENEGWDILQDTRYAGDIYLYDNERDMFAPALKALGYSMNTNDPKQLEEAYQWLLQVVQTMNTEIVTDEIIDNMANARKALGIVYSGDATYILSENDQMGYFMPGQGTNIWVDGMCIPKNAKNVPLAYAFINFVAQYESQILNSEFVGYTSPKSEAAAELAQGEFEGLNSYIPREGYALDESFGYNADTRKIIADYWSRVKIAASNVQ